MKIVDIASEIYYNNGSPTYTSVPAIAYWVRSKIGTINNLLFESLSINASTLDVLYPNGQEISPEIVAVIFQIYRVYDLEVQIRNLMNALASNSIIAWEDQGGTLAKRVNKNEMAKTLNAIRKDELKVLQELITAYRSRSSPPSQIAGDDTQIGYFEPYRMYYPR